MKTYGFIYSQNEQFDLSSVHNRIILPPINYIDLWEPYTFQYNIDNLNPNTFYTFQAFANNIYSETEISDFSTSGGDVTYSNRITIKTLLPPLPELLMISAHDIYYDSAYLLGEITKNYYNLITNHGFCWDISSNPTVDNSFIDLGPYDGLGQTFYIIKDLQHDTKYYLSSEIQILQVERVQSMYPSKSTMGNLGKPVNVTTFSTCGTKLLYFVLDSSLNASLIVAADIILPSNSFAGGFVEMIKS